NEMILFYDSSCGLCHWAVMFLLKRDKFKKLKFAPLFGETYQVKVKMDLLNSPDSVVFYNDEKLFFKSSAIIHVMIALGGVNVFAGLLFLVPRYIRDFFYDQIAKRRKKLFCGSEKGVLGKEGRFFL
ncbi:MAG: DUF393 domain-containing protein, partial [Bacteriovorax sp.]|nr:DUF393 domain-containing protein [Bacteriovorax sp.]